MVQRRINNTKIFRIHVPPHFSYLCRCPDYRHDMRYIKMSDGLSYSDFSVGATSQLPDLRTHLQSSLAFEPQHGF